MGERISRLMDSDLDDAAAEAAFQDLKRPDGVDTWVCYHVIGDALRRTTDPTPGFGARFAARLAAEPTVLAPTLRNANRLPFAWAVAATVAAVMVVGWVAVSTLDPQPTALARAREAASVRSAQGMPQPVSGYAFISLLAIVESPISHTFVLCGGLVNAAVVINANIAILFILPD